MNEIINYITSYNSYELLYCKEHIQMISYYSTTNVEMNINEINKMTTMDQIKLDIILLYIILTVYYIPMDTVRWQINNRPVTSNYSTINLEKNNRLKQRKTMHWITPVITLHYLTFTFYYFVNEKVKWQVITEPQMWKQI